MPANPPPPPVAANTPAPAAPIAITMGEPAGVGPDLCAIALNSDLPKPLVVIGDRHLIATRARQHNLPLTVEDYQHNPAAHRAIWHHPAAHPAAPTPHPENAHSILETLQQATHHCLRGTFSALVTAPLSKASIHAIDPTFTGQTEHLAKLTGVPRSVMLLASPPSSASPSPPPTSPSPKSPPPSPPAILIDTLHILHNGLKQHFATPTPRIRVCALNPHAGESGLLGDEEDRIIRPAITAARAAGIAVDGPHPADTLMPNAKLPETACILAMYHDQGLPVIKWADFDPHRQHHPPASPFLRTSPDHGIALDQVGKPTLRPRQHARRPPSRRKMKKRYGQHFLRDRTVIHRIIDAINPTPADTLLEIGPGDGALTAPLLDSGARLTAIEIDRDCAAQLRHRFGDRLQIITADILTLDLPALTPAPTRLIGNLPYNISTPLLHRIAAAGPHLTDSHIMLQKEVSDPPHRPAPPPPNTAASPST